MRCHLVHGNLEKEIGEKQEKMKEKEIKGIPLIQYIYIFNDYGWHDNLFEYWNILE